MEMYKWLRGLDLEAELEEQARLLLELVQEEAYKSPDELLSIIENITSIIAEMKRLEKGQ